MKKIIVFLFIFITSLSAQQYYYTFSELRGMEDNSANTHLFYRLYTYEEAPVIGDYFENSIYHFDLGNATDTLFLYEGGRIGDMSVRIVDLEFWNNNPQTYIYLGEGISVDPVAFIQRFDQQQALYSELGEAYSLELGKQNDSLVFATAPYLMKSIDGGFNWSPYTIPLKVVSISTFSDDVIFFTNWDGDLVKTNDGLQSITTVDTQHYSPELFYDSDSLHIYSLTNNRLKVSDVRGNAFSWVNRYLGSNKIFLTVDYSQSGKIYVADGRRIYFSENYGNTFSEYKVLNRNIVGIYKKPNSDKLYVATKYDLYEITPDTTIILKHLVPDPEVARWFPLKIGNKWVYEEQIEFDKKRFSVEVIDDTIINGKYYFKLKTILGLNNFGNSYQRLDSTYGIVYRFSVEGDIPVYDFTVSEIGDTVIFNEEDGIGWTLSYKILFSQWGINSTARYYTGVMNFSGYQSFAFVKDVGLYREEFREIIEVTVLLKGFIKDGVVYGDTAMGVVSVEDEENLPLVFSLSQNYPNPFNPTTKIKFSIPSVVSTPIYRGRNLFVTLKVYDILGREVATLVNEEKQPGVYEVEFDASNLSSGIYYYHLKSGDFVETKKMILLR